MLVDSVTVSTVSAAKGQKSGRAVVVVIDDQGSPGADVVVTGTFTGSFIETVISLATDAAGSTTIDTSTTAKGGVSFTFFVDTITGGSLNYAGTGDCGSL